MLSRLNPEVKRALLEQSLRVQTQNWHHSDVFVKFLCLNHFFINVGHFYKITQLCMDIDSQQPSVKFYFGTEFGNRTRDFRFTAKEARQLIKLFRIRLFKAHSYHNYGDQFDEFWHLMDYVEGKIDLFIPYSRYSNGLYNISGDIMNCFWHKITTLHAPSKLISTHWNQSRKHFDKLVVSHVYTIADLKRILRHDAHELEIYYVGNLTNQEVNQFLETGKKVRINHCKLNRGATLANIDVIVPLVKCIAGIAPKCQKIEICIYKYHPRNVVANTADELVVQISQFFETFNTAKTLLAALPYILQLSFSTSCDTSLIQEPQNTENGWLSLLKQNNSEFINCVQKVYTEEGVYWDEIIVETVDGNLTSKFECEVHFEISDEGRNNN